MNKITGLFFFFITLYSCSLRSEDESIMPTKEISLTEKSAKKPKTISRLNQERLSELESLQTNDKYSFILPYISNRKDYIECYLNTLRYAGLEWEIYAYDVVQKGNQPDSTMIGEHFMYFEPMEKPFSPNHYIFFKTTAALNHNNLFMHIYAQNSTGYLDKGSSLSPGSDLKRGTDRDFLNIKFVHSKIKNNGTAFFDTNLANIGNCYVESLILNKYFYLKLINVNTGNRVYLKSCSSSERKITPSDQVLINTKELSEIVALYRGHNWIDEGIYYLGSIAQSVLIPLEVLVSPLFFPGKSLIKKLLNKSKENNEYVKTLKTQVPPESKKGEINIKIDKIVININKEEKSKDSNGNNDPNTTGNPKDQTQPSDNSSNNGDQSKGQEEKTTGAEVKKKKLCPPCTIL